jgi:hypothetical protein
MNPPKKTPKERREEQQREREFWNARARDPRYRDDTGRVYPLIEDER